MNSKESNNQKDPLLDELTERILERPVVFTPDESFSESRREKDR